MSWCSSEYHWRSQSIKNHQHPQKIQENYRNLQRIQKSQKKRSIRRSTWMYSSFSRRVKHIVVYDIFRIFLIVLIRLDLIIIKIKHMNLAIVHNHPQIFNSFQLFVLIHIHLCMQMHMIRYNQSSFFVFLAISCYFYSFLFINCYQFGSIDSLCWTRLYVI